MPFTLGQPMDAAPGTKWGYNSGGSQLLSGIIRTATGRFIDDYATEMLFRPLGIRDFHWKKTPTGHPDTEGGLYLSAEDLAKIGLLYLRDGMWDGKRILPRGMGPRGDNAPRDRPAGRMGLRLSVVADVTRDGVEVWAGRGFGGQFLIVIPSRDIVAVIHSWNVFGVQGAADLRTIPVGADESIVNRFHHLRTRRDFLQAVGGTCALTLRTRVVATQPRTFAGARAGEQRVIEGIRLCWCPPGRFLMGSPPDEAGRRPDEAQVSVTLTRGFWMGTFEVTQGEWKRIVGACPAGSRRRIWARRRHAGVLGELR